jgi:hypothetical protein
MFLRMYFRKFRRIVVTASSWSILPYRRRHYGLPEAQGVTFPASQRHIFDSTAVYTSNPAVAFSFFMAHSITPAAPAFGGSASNARPSGRFSHIHIKYVYVAPSLPVLQRACDKHKHVFNNSTKQVFVRLRIAWKYV